MNFSGKSPLITGEIGSLGKALTKYILTNYLHIRKLILFSKDEQKKFQRAQEYPRDQSVIPLFIKKKNKGALPIINKNITTFFNISRNRGVGMLIPALEHSWDDEIFINKITPYKILDFAVTIELEWEKSLVGIRPEEKVREKMIIPSSKYYAILPAICNWNVDHSVHELKVNKVLLGFS